MYNAIMTWFQNQLISTQNNNCRTEYDQEYQNKLQKKLKGYTNTVTIISQKPNAPEESFYEMDLEVGGKRVKSTKVFRATADKKPPKNRANETGDDVLKSGQISYKTESNKYILKQEQAVKPKIQIAIPKFANEAQVPRTKSKTELTRKELMSQECTQRQTERIVELNREKEENDENAEVLGIPLPFRSIGERSSMTDLHKLLQQCPQPQPPLINKQLKNLQLNADQAIIMTEQVKKMKTGMERLQEVIKKFNCTEKFKQDIDFIITNVGPALAKSERMRRSEQSVCDSQNDQINK